MLLLLTISVAILESVQTLERSLPHSSTMYTPSRSVDTVTPQSGEEAFRAEARDQVEHPLVPRGQRDIRNAGSSAASLTYTARHGKIVVREQN